MVGDNQGKRYLFMDKSRRCRAVEGVCPTLNVSKSGLYTELPRFAGRARGGGQRPRFPVESEDFLKNLRCISAIDSVLDSRSDRLDDAGYSPPLSDYSEAEGEPALTSAICPEPQLEAYTAKIGSLHFLGVSAFDNYLMNEEDIAPLYSLPAEMADTPMMSYGVGETNRAAHVAL